jgi:hypothetical protein
MRTIKTGIVAFASLAVSGIIAVHAQNALRFTGIRVSPENAIWLNWASNSNEVYEIDYADSLVDTNTGSTTWQTLYNNYPSQGSNTFIGDFGNYDNDTNIVDPKFSSMRFYRIVDEGTNDGESPFVVITSPTTNSVLSGLVTVSVVATSSMPVLFLQLWVDGQRMDESDDGSNFVINTCEWLNGPHTLYAIATAQSSFSGPSGNFPITIGRSVSAFVPVTFSNLITGVAFSQPFFEPSLAQTQQVTASFAANVNWTLQIVNTTSNAVRNVSGSGISLDFSWDGTGDGETNVPDGVYYYVITAETNGEAFDASFSRTASVLASSGSDAEVLYAVPTDGSGSAVPFALYPPGADTNDLTFFETSPLEFAGSRDTSSSGRTAFGSYADGSSEPAGSSTPSSQSTTTPTRPPTAPIKNAVNNYAVGFYDFTNNVSRLFPKNGLPFPSTATVHLDGCPTCTTETYSPIPEANNTSVNMIRAMKKLGWKLAFQRFDDLLSVNAMRRNDIGYSGAQIFTQATIGLFVDHGSYGLDPDYNPGSSMSKQTYFPSGDPNDGAGDSSWLRMCQFGFGGNLQWMAILACNCLCDPNYGSMSSAGAIPLKTTHLLCGTSTIAWIGEDIAANWGNNMIKKNEAIKQAWFDAGSQQYHAAAAGAITNTVIFRVTGYPECMGDTIANNTAPSSPSPNPGNLTKQDQQVYP